MDEQTDKLTDGQNCDG